MAYPVRDVIRPAVLAGQSNGHLADSILVSVPGQAGGPTVRLVAPAAAAWQALCAAARSAGHILKASGPYDSYRPYDVQVSTFTTRYTTTKLAGRPSRTWQGHTWWQRPGTAVAAVPGTSNHGLGLAVDVGVELDGDPGTESLTAAALGWLIANELRFGFSHEIQSEPWHIRYWAGDRPPAAPTPTIGDDMTFVRGNDAPLEGAIYMETAAGLHPVTDVQWAKVSPKAFTGLPSDLLQAVLDAEAAARPAAQLAELKQAIIDAVKAGTGGGPVDPAVIEEAVTSVLTRLRIVAA
jgi:hypothetical protein